MANYNKNKGKSFERELAKHLTSVFGLNFNRVPNSGAFTGGKNFFRTAQLTQAQQLLTVGDIIPPEQLSSFSWECKFYQDFPFNTIFSENTTLDKWIEQAKCPDRNWFLVFKINHAGAFVVFNPAESIPIYKITGNYAFYKGCVIQQMEGFFEANKEMMLANNKAPVSPPAPVDPGPAKLCGLAP